MASKSQCARCGRGLKDPKSIARGMGPICWAESGGGIFDADLQADEKEWARREEVLKSGGEIDLGVNWQYPLDYGETVNMRVSVRYKDGAFEAYGCLMMVEKLTGRYGKEVLFFRSNDLKEVYKAAIEAGPYWTAVAYQLKRKADKAWKASQKIRGRALPPAPGPSAGGGG